MRNDHISGVELPISPPVTAELGLAQVGFAVCDALHWVFLILDQMAAWCFSKLECYLESKYEIKSHMENCLDFIANQFYKDEQEEYFHSHFSMFVAQS